MQKSTTSTLLVCVLYNKGEEGKLTLETQERIIASCKISKKLCFVGAGAKSMSDYASLNGAETIAILDNCSSTIGNIKEIKKFVEENHQYKEVVIISHRYHLNRIDYLCRFFDLKAKSLGADFINVNSKIKINYLEPAKFLYTKLLKLLNLLK